MLKHGCLYAIMALLLVGAQVPMTRGPGDLQYPWYKKEAPPPAPIPPIYTKLKDLHLATDLVKSGKPNAVIVAPPSPFYEEQARRIQRAIQERSGVILPIVSDAGPQAAVPISGHLIALGNRSTNRTIGALYDRFYAILDLRYPGREGYVVRTVHNPFGNGKNVVLVGGSDPIGMKSAVDDFIGRLGQAEGNAGSLRIGWLADIRLGSDVVIPDDIKSVLKWDDFGWNTVTKTMALYYMTGEERYLKEFLRLAFPDETAIKELQATDWYYLDDESAPLASPHHYGAHMMILYWDLIEESPLLSDEVRLRVTNAFSRQLAQRLEDRYNFLQIKGRVIYNRRTPYPGLDYRHGTMSALCLYVLGRYFDKDYPSPVWKQARRGPEMVFASLHGTAWIEGDENDDWRWQNTFIAPILTYLLLTGDRVPLENGVLKEVMRAQEFMVTGKKGDRALVAASAGYLHQAAYLLQDGRYVHFREMSGLDTGAFRLGQSFWPEEHLRTGFPADLIGKWTVWGLPETHWRARGNGYRLEESFYGASYRSTGDGGGDFLLVDGYNGDGRNPYHCFATVDLRLGGLTLLEGYRNQVWTLADGLAEPAIPRDTALRHSDVIGRTAVFVGDVPRAPFSRWQRSIALRRGKYALFVDDLTYRSGDECRDVQVLWEPAASLRSSIPGPGMLRLEAQGTETAEAGPSSFDICLSDPLETTSSGKGAYVMRSRGPARAGQRDVLFSVCAPSPADSRTNPVCGRLAWNAAALALPEPALAVVGEHDGVAGELVILAADHLFGKSLTSSGPGGLFVSDQPLDVDWDFRAGRMSLAAAKSGLIRCRAASGLPVIMNGSAVAAQPEDGVLVLRLTPGRHALEKIVPAAEAVRHLTGYLEAGLGRGRAARGQAAPGTARTPRLEASPLPEVFTAVFDGRVADLETVPAGAGAEIFAAAGRTIHVLTPAGAETGRLSVDGPVRSLRWWPDHDLLLAGGADDRVSAFDRSGRRAWTFTSELDPAVVAWGLIGWMKETHPGVYGLSTGVFLDNTSQAFVGSACTLEILDHSGKLVRRLPQFWGPPAVFALTDGPEGSINLLAGRSPADHHGLGIINSRRPDPELRGFDAPPAGQSNIRTFLGTNRNFLFYDDLDGDGRKEVVSDVNGYWNRIQVWDGRGVPLYAASVGPGESHPARNIRGLEIADLDGDGQKEILAATASGFVIALDGRCQKRWSTLLPSPAQVMKCVPAPRARTVWTVVGCENGQVLALDEHGAVSGWGMIEGNPSAIEPCPISPKETGIILGTEAGMVRMFRIAQ